MTRGQGSVDDLATIAQLLRNLLAIELWRGGLTQAEIGVRLGVATGSVNKMLKDVNREVAAAVCKEE